jgi:hypothetical protein
MMQREQGSKRHVQAATPELAALSCEVGNSRNFQSFGKLEISH